MLLLVAFGVGSFVVVGFWLCVWVVWVSVICHFGCCVCLLVWFAWPLLDLFWVYGLWLFGWFVCLVEGGLVPILLFVVLALWLVSWCFRVLILVCYGCLDFEVSVLGDVSGLF